MLTSSTTDKIAGVDVFVTEGHSSELPGSSFITPVAFAIASTPDTARTMPTKPLQLCQNPPESGFKLCQASPRCGKEKIARAITVITVGQRPQQPILQYVLDRKSSMHRSRE